MLAGLMLFLVLGVSGVEPGMFCREFNPDGIRAHNIQCSSIWGKQSCLLTTGYDRLNSCAALCIGERTLTAKNPLQAGHMIFEESPGKLWTCTVTY